MGILDSGYPSVHPLDSLLVSIPNLLSDLNVFLSWFLGAGWVGSWG